MSYEWNWHVFEQSASRSETYADWLFDGAKMTLILGLSAWALALVIGFGLGVLRCANQRRYSLPAATYVEVFRNVPLLVQLFIWYFVLPELIPGGKLYKSLDPVVQQFSAAILCLALFTAARVCEQVRAGLNAIPTGRLQAGLALGLTPAQTYRFILLPVAARTIIPALTSEFLAVFKNSSVMSTIGLLELAAQGRQLVDYTAQPYESFLAVSVIFLVINGVVMLGMRQLDMRSRFPGQTIQR